jgi:hypothetical protein
MIVKIFYANKYIDTNLPEELKIFFNIRKQSVYMCQVQRIIVNNIPHFSWQYQPQHL